MADEAETPEESSRIRVGLIVGVVAAAALLLFMFQNTDKQDVTFLFWSWEMPLFLLLLITFVLSVIVTLLAIWFIRRRD